MHKEEKPSTKVKAKVVERCHLEFISTEEELFTVLQSLEMLHWCHGCSDDPTHVKDFYQLTSLQGQTGRNARRGKVVTGNIFALKCDVAFKKKKNRTSMNAKHMCDKCSRYKRSFIKQVKRLAQKPECSITKLSKVCLF